MWTTIMFGGLIAALGAKTVSSLWHLCWVHRLPPRENSAHPFSDALRQGISSPRCTVIVAARDEEVRIEQTVLRLLAQQEVELQIVVVDDRSSDRTGEILSRLARADKRVRIKRVDILPDGWLGKCHACHLAAKGVTTDWMLFTDADCWMKPDVIVRAIRLAEMEQADHVTLSPGTVVETEAAKAWHLLFLITVLSWFSGVNRDRPKAYMGVGAFNLVRSSAYSICGGHERLRLTVVDDVKLGLLLRRAGKRTRACLGGDDVLCQWGGTVRSMIKIMEKNYFAVLDFRLSLVLCAALGFVLVLAIMILGLVSNRTLGRVAVLSPCLLIVPAVLLARKIGWNWMSALAVPLMLPVFFYTLLNSTYVTLRNGGIRWRNTFYRLDVLREGNVQNR